MKEFNLNKWRQFVIAEGNFGNDPQDRYNYARKFTADLPDTARSEYLVSNLEDALEDYKLTDEVGEFDQAFVDVMKALGKENELSEELATPNEMSAMAIEKEMAEGIPDVNTDFSVDTDFSADLSENDDALDEVINEAKPNLKKALPTIAARNVERNNNINFDIEEMMNMVGEAGKGEDSKEAKILFRASNASSDLEQALVDLQASFEDNLSENDDTLDEILKEEKFNVIVKDTGEIIDDGLPKDLATKLAAKKKGWVIQKVEEALDEVKDAKFEIGDKVTMKAGGGEMEIVGARKMFGNNTQAYKVKKADGETVEYSANQLKKA
jgi:uncharacterized protein YodC (DUF2158 family)